MNNHNGSFDRFERIDRRLASQRKQYRRMQDERVREWLDHVHAHANQVGAEWPQPVELDLLRKLAEINGTFTAAQIGRNGWCGIRTTAAASSTLERFVSNGWLYRLPPNRLGQAQYGFTREAALGEDHLGGRVVWDSWAGMYEGVPDNKWTRGATGRPGFNPLIAAGFIEGGTPDEFTEATGEEFDGVGYDFCSVPDPSAECDIWVVAHKLASEKNTYLHRIAESMEGLSPIQQAYAMAIAQDRVNPEFAPLSKGNPTGESYAHSNDPVGVHIRGVAEYLGVDYNTLRAAVNAAVAAIREITTGAATHTPTIEV